jgi:putative flippase GtrA
LNFDSWKVIAYLALIPAALLQKFLRFGIVGFSGLFVDFGFTYLLKERLKVDKFVSNGVGFMLAASSNYILNRIWTFQSTNPNVAVEYGEFILIAVIGLIINTLILWVLVTRLNMNFYLSKVLAIAVVTIWNFGANLLFTFNQVV